MKSIAVVYHHGMLFYARPKEGLLSMTGALVLTALAIALGLPQIYEKIPPMLKNEIGILAIEVFGAFILFFGLGIGFLRHRDATPVLFSVLGLGVLMMYSFGNFPQFLPIICAACFMIAGTWDIFLPTEDDSGRVTEAPRLDAFLDNTLLPSENKDDDTR